MQRKQLNKLILKYVKKRNHTRAIKYKYYGKVSKVTAHAITNWINTTTSIIDDLRKLRDRLC